jgi:hypothetical protein
MIYEWRQRHDIQYNDIHNNDNQQNNLKCNTALR